MDTILKAKALKNKAYDALSADDSDEVRDLLTQADQYLEKALELYQQGAYAEALLLAEKAVKYYEEVLQLLT